MIKQYRTMRNERLYIRVLEIIENIPGVIRSEIAKQLKAEGFFPNKFLHEVSGSVGSVIRALEAERKIRSVKISMSTPAKYFPVKDQLEESNVST